MDRVQGSADPLGICLNIVREAARKELELNAENDWWVVVEKYVDLRSFFSSSALAPVELIGKVLIHEPNPLVYSTSEYNYRLQLGNGRFSNFRDVSDVEGYLNALSLKSEDEDSSLLPASPLGLPAVLDYLGYILAAHDDWAQDRHLINLPDFQSGCIHRATCEYSGGVQPKGKRPMEHSRASKHTRGN